MQAKRKTIVGACLGWAAAVAVATGIGACGASDSPTKPPSAEAAAIVTVDGGGQRGFVGELLDIPITVEVADSAFRVIRERRPIRFSVAQGGGSVSDTVLLSNESGRATVRWVLGPETGLQQLAVRVADAPSSRESRIIAQAFSPEAADRIVVRGATSGTVDLLVRRDDAVSPYKLVWPDTVLRLLPRSAEGSWEEVTAFTVGHPPESIVRPWTDDADTVRIALRPPIPVPFTLWITRDFDTTAARARNDLDALDLFWRTQMTGLRVGRVRVENIPGVGFHCGEDTRGYFDRAAINIYYTEFFSPVTCDARIILMHRNNPFSFIGDYQLVLAHEVGHALSLDHVFNSGNVMWPDSPPGFGLTTGQIYWMHFHYWGALNSVLSIHPAAERNCNLPVSAHCPAQTFAAR